MFIDEQGRLQLTSPAFSGTPGSGRRSTLRQVEARRFPFSSVLLALLSFAGVSRFTQAQTPAPDFDTVITQANEARNQHDLPAALRLYREAVEMKADWAEGWWSLGTLEYASDQYTPARDALTHFITLTPNGGPALALRGLCEFELGQYPESLEDLQHGIALGAANSPRNAPIVLYHEALVLTRLGRFDEATAKYTAFVQHAAVDPELVVAVGLAGLRRPVLPKEVDPLQVDLVAAVGNAAMPLMTGDVPAGAQAFEKIFATYPAMPNLHYFYAYLLFAAHSDEAIPQFEKEIAISPHSAFAHAMLAWSLGFSGDYANALPAAKAASEEDPSLLLGQMMYGRSLIETGNVAGGLPYIENVLQQDSSNLEAHLTLAKAYSELGRKDEAWRERQVCLKMAEQEAPANATR